MRKPNWQAAFWSALEAHRQQPFAYGVRDCILFGSSMADAITIEADYTARAKRAFAWKNKREALRLLKDRALQSMIEDVLGPMQKWSQLQMGDLVLCTQDGQILAVHDGTRPIAPGDRTLVPLRWADALGGWRID